VPKNARRVAQVKHPHTPGPHLRTLAHNAGVLLRELLVLNYSTGVRTGTGQKGTAHSGAGSDVLHDVEAAALERPRHELASASDVFVAGNAAKSWGANLPGSPVIAADDPEERATIFLVWVGNWSDGTLAPQDMY
jgi:hypothetical protein